MSDRNDPLVSIVLPNRNHAEFLPDSLGAFVRQTRKNYEVLIVDDASTDNSREVIESWCAQDNRFKLIQSAQHLGINAAVMYGLKQASGEFLYIAAADDIIAPDFLEKSISMLEENPDAAFCFSDPSELNAKGDINVYPLYLSTASRFFEKEQFADLLRRNFFNVSANTILYRKVSFEDAGGYLEDLGWLSDWFAATVASLRFGVCYIPECLTHLRVRKDSYSAVNLKRTAEHRELVARVFKYLRSENYADVCGFFRASALLPEYRLRTIWWLLSDRNGRCLITGRLLKRVLWRGTWYYARNLAPSPVRRSLRRRSSLHAVQKLGSR